MALLNFLKVRDGDTSKAVKTKQISLLFVGILILLSLLYAFVVGFSNVTQTAPPKDKSKKVVIGNLVSEKDIWAARLEGQVLKMAEIARNFKKQNDLQSKRLKTLENALILQEKQKGGKVGHKASAQKSVGPTVRSAGLPTAGLGQVSSSPSPASFSSEGRRPSSQGMPPLKKILHFSNDTQDSFHHANDYVVAGSYAKAVLSSGVAASSSIASQGNPQPIVMRLGDQGNLPRGWKSRLKDAVMIGSCYGDLSSERAMCRLHTLSFVEPNGRTVEKQVEGWIIGEDGIPGLRGLVVDRAGKIVRESFIAGMLSGMSNFFKSASQSSVFPVSPFGQTDALKTGDVLKSGAASGASNALEKLADFSIKRAESMSPVIVVHPGRVVDVVFKSGFSLTGSSRQSLRPVQSSSKKGN